MNLETLEKEEIDKTQELLLKSFDKVSRGEKIDILEDLIPEFRDLKNKSYTIWMPPRSPEIAEKYPSHNLGTLLSSSMYDHIIVPVSAEPNEAIFTYTYGLSENRGCRVSFDQFLGFIRDGKLKPITSTRAGRYSPKFYNRIFKACEQQEKGYFPPNSWRIGELFHCLKFEKLATSDKVERTGGWEDVVGEKHPEYVLPECVKEIKKVLKDVDLNSVARIYGCRPVQRIFGILATDLYELRMFGFEGIAEVALKSLQLDPELGSWALHKYGRYLVDPIDVGLFGFNNYRRESIEKMLFLRLIPKDLGHMWKELLSSSPASSSVLSPQATLNTVELRGDDLTRFVDTHPEEELKNSVKGMNACLAEFDLVGAVENFERFDQVVAERFNKEIRSMSRKGHVANNILRFGKSFLDSSVDVGAAFLGAVMAAAGQFQWLPAIFLGAVAAKYGERKLNEIKPEDVVRWWSDIWPFSDPGLPFVLWFKTEKEKRSS